LELSRQKDHRDSRGRVAD